MEIKHKIQNFKTMYIYIYIYIYIYRPVSLYIANEEKCIDIHMVHIWDVADCRQERHSCN